MQNTENYHFIREKEPAAQGEHHTPEKDVKTPLKVFFETDLRT
jgi:hypothetical protein